MVSIIEQDIFDSNFQVIVHQTNCLGKMNSGIAKEIRNRYPIVYEEYCQLCSKYKPIELLGAIQTIPISKDKYIINLFGQLKYGTDKRYTNYEAFQNGLNLILREHDKYDIKSISFPYKIGCNLAGGDWTVIYNLIVTTFRTTNLNIGIFKKE